MQPGRHLRLSLIAVAALAAVALGGCAGTRGTDVAAGAAVAHTPGGVAYKTFAAPTGELRVAALKALGRMDLTVVKDGPMRNTHAIVATATKRRVEIALEALAGGTSRMMVVANEGAQLREDMAAAVEVIVQTAASLDDIAQRRQLAHLPAPPRG